MSKISKTNAMRKLDSLGIEYDVHSYVADKDHVPDGGEVAQKLGQDANRVFKTLVARHSKDIYVFMIPVLEHLDLKKAAKGVGVKSLEMVHVKELLGLTGYVRGGCSPIGMKKSFPTFAHKSILDQDSVIFSGGKIGLQIEMNPLELVQGFAIEIKDLVQ